MGQMTAVKRPDGATTPAYLAEAPNATPGTPAIVLLQEWWGCLLYTSPSPRDS